MVSSYLISGGDHPFKAATDADVETNIKHGQPNLTSMTDCLAVHLVGRMLENSPHDRPQVSTLCGY